MREMEVQQEGILSWLADEAWGQRKNITAMSKDLAQRSKDNKNVSRRGFLKVFKGHGKNMASTFADRRVRPTLQRAGVVTTFLRYPEALASGIKASTDQKLKQTFPSMAQSVGSSLLGRVMDVTPGLRTVRKADRIAGAAKKGADLFGKAEKAAGKFADLGATAASVASGIETRAALSNFNLRNKPAPAPPKKTTVKAPKKKRRPEAPSPVADWIASKLPSPKKPVYGFGTRLANRLKMKSASLNAWDESYDTRDLITAIYHGTSPDSLLNEISLDESGRWIQKAVKRPGAFTAKARAAGMETQEFADRVIGTNRKEKENEEDRTYDTRTVRQALLAKRFASFARKKKRSA